MTERGDTYLSDRVCKCGYCERYVNRNQCVRCTLASSRRSYAVNRQRVMARQREYVTANIEYVREYHRRYGLANRDKKNKRSRDWYADNREAKQDQNRKWNAANRESRLEYYRNYAKANPSRVAAAVAKRRADTLQATPWWLTWAQRMEIDAIYANCAMYSAQFGIKLEVDHVVPLKGRNVCGLHVPWNLEIVSQSENRRKSNRLSEVTSD